MDDPDYAFAYGGRRATSATSSGGTMPSTPPRPTVGAEMEGVTVQFRQQLGALGRIPPLHWQPPRRPGPPDASAGAAAGSDSEQHAAADSAEADSESAEFSHDHDPSHRECDGHGRGSAAARDFTSTGKLPRPGSAAHAAPGGFKQL